MHLRPAITEVDLEAIQRNYLEAVRRAGAGRHVIASVKANAYGHGALEVARALERYTPYAYWTGHVPEAISLRQAGIKTKIIMFGGYLPESIPDLVKHDLIPTIYDESGFLAAAKASSSGKPISVYVKVDAGLGRLGVALSSARAFVNRVANCGPLRLEGVYTHLPFKDKKGEEWALERSAAFQQLLADLRQDGVEPPVTQLWGSSGFLANLPDATNTVCLGHLLYGLSPVSSEVAAFDGFRPVFLRLTGHLIHVAHHNPGNTTSLLSQYQTAHATATGVIAFGLGDGMRRPMNGATIRVLVRGQPVPVVGTSLEHTIVDLSAVDSPQVGDEAVFVGRMGNREITLEDWAEWFGCSPLEVIINFSGRVAPKYINQADAVWASFGGSDPNGSSGERRHAG
jgi:alanine racemase